jgi:hypothetical protein
MMTNKEADYYVYKIKLLRMGSDVRYGRMIDYVLVEQMSSFCCIVNRLIKLYSSEVVLLGSASRAVMMMV